MHFEILVEDLSGKKALDILVPKIIKNFGTFKVIPYKGIGRIPANLNSKGDPSKRILLMQLPKLLRGYGKAFANNPSSYPVAVIIICDLDNRILEDFLNELDAVLGNCSPKPDTHFCIAIEEGEAWFLGDITAIKSAYPKAKDSVLNKYVNDSICGTWEILADAIHKGGSNTLSSQGWQKIGTEKSNWAEKITPHMNVDSNNSPSFCHFRDRLVKLAAVI
jgi:Domain of unknown function (DUF4276)